MSIGLVILLGVIGFIFIAGFFGAKEAKRAGIKAKKLFKAIDEKYEEFIEKKIASHILNNDSIEINIETYKKEVITVIKPDIEALIEHINATTYSSVNVEYNSTYFNNATQMTITYFAKSRKNEGKVLTKQDEADFFIAFGDGIAADLTTRKLELGSRY